MQHKQCKTTQNNATQHKTMQDNTTQLQTNITPNEAQYTTQHYQNKTKQGPT